MSMWFFDDFPNLADYQALRKEMRALEREYLEVRQLLAQAEEALRENPGEVYLTARVAYYTKRRRGLEALAPRLADEYPLEVALFLPPHG